MRFKFSYWSACLTLLCGKLLKHLHRNISTNLHSVSMPWWFLFCSVHWMFCPFFSPPELQCKTNLILWGIKHFTNWLNCLLHTPASNKRRYEMAFTSVSWHLGEGQARQWLTRQLSLVPLQTYNFTEIERNLDKNDWSLVLIWYLDIQFPAFSLHSQQYISIT